MNSPTESPSRHGTFVMHPYKESWRRGSLDRSRVRLLPRSDLLEPLHDFRFHSILIVALEAQERLPVL